MTWSQPMSLHDYQALVRQERKKARRERRHLQRHMQIARQLRDSNKRRDDHYAQKV